MFSLFLSSARGVFPFPGVRRPRPCNNTIYNQKKFSFPSFKTHEVKLVCKGEVRGRWCAHLAGGQRCPRDCVADRSKARSEGAVGGGDRGPIELRSKREEGESTLFHHVFILSCISISAYTK